MWTCDKCQRVFQKDNQSHICVVRDVGELFVGKSDDMVLAWDAVTQAVMLWQPNVYAPVTKSIVYTSRKAWLIVKPMKSKLELKFYYPEPIEHERIKRCRPQMKKYACFIHLQQPEEVDDELLELLRMGYAYSVA